MNPENGFKKAREITRKQAKSFFFASRLLPKAKRNASYSVYSICRISDDSVDKPKESIETLDEIEKKIDLAYSREELEDDLIAAFRKTITKYKIPRKYFDDLIDGIRLDMEKKRYENFLELITYCHKVAGVVGLIMLKIFGYNKPQAEKYAVDLGIAMQLTNILRDIKEDFSLGRIYLPKAEMQKFDINEATIKNSQLEDNFIEFMRFQIVRARDYYNRAEKGIIFITDKRCRLAAMAMSKIYSAILSSIENNGYDVFSRRSYVSMPVKIKILAQTILGSFFRY
ncbi:MAG: phytoene/squalene synthase family protein [Candidatus Omnitrophica bacterium]|nr:phytoene/squalene synthase family protein [Candidatus Omnitrophota bacterium]